MDSLAEGPSTLREQRERKGLKLSCPPRRRRGGAAPTGGGSSGLPRSSSIIFLEGHTSAHTPTHIPRHRLVGAAPLRQGGREPKEKVLGTGQAYARLLRRRPHWVQ